MEKYIAELLENNNRVIIPDFGAFIVKQGEKKSITFNEFLKFNDGLLVNYVADKENIDKNEATAKVKTYAEELRANLKKGDKIKITDLGILHLDDKGRITFSEGMDSPVEEKKSPTGRKAGTTEDPGKKDAKPGEKPGKESEIVTGESLLEIKDEKKDIPAKTGKEKLPKPPVPPKKSGKTDPSEEKRTVNNLYSGKSNARDEGKMKETPPPSPPPPPPANTTASAHERKMEEKRQEAYLRWQEAKQKKSEKGGKRRSRTWLWILIILLLLLGAAAYWYFNYYEPTDETLVAEEETTAPAEAVDTIMEDEELTEEPEPQPEPEPMPTIPNKEYHVVAGCFMYESNADNYVDRLQDLGYPAEKFGMVAGLHGVSFMSFDDRREAIQKMREIKANVEPNAWVRYH
jgi:nucleoid DNA-binding protein